jgi:hypothetical protein
MPKTSARRLSACAIRRPALSIVVTPSSCGAGALIIPARNDVVLIRARARAIDPIEKIVTVRLLSNVVGAWLQLVVHPRISGRMPGARLINR